jgi:hypothetical protein
VRLRSGLVASSAVGITLMAAGLAAADRCHATLAGTRSLTVRADVIGYRFAGDRIVVQWARSPACRGIASWDYTAVARTTARLACRTGSPARVVSSFARLGASDATRTVHVVAAPGSADTATRLDVLDRAGRRLASWPLPITPARVVVSSGYAILSNAARGELFAARLSDGRIAQIGVTRAGDRPAISPAGIVYEDDIDRPKYPSGRTERTLRFVPMGTVQREVARPFTTVRRYMSYSTPMYVSVRSPATRTRRPAARRPMYRKADPPRTFTSPTITAMAMDGERVALAVRDPRGRCDYVAFWNVAWHYVTRLTRAMGLTCPPTHATGGITAVAIAGSRAAWAVDYGGTTRVIAAVITDCQEWIVTRPTPKSQRLAALAGDGGVLAYAVSPRRRSARPEVGIVSSTWGGESLPYTDGSPVGLSVDDGRVSALDANGSVVIETRTGQPIASFRVGPARAVALRGDDLAVLTNAGRIDVYNVGGTRVRSWSAPLGATSIDVQYGIAVVAAGRDVYAVNLVNGRAARLLRAPSAVRAEVEAPGAAIQYNVGRRGFVRFVPMSKLEALTR